MDDMYLGVLPSSYIHFHIVIAGEAFSPYFLMHWLIRLPLLHLDHSQPSSNPRHQSLDTLLDISNFVAMNPASENRCEFFYHQLQRSSAVSFGDSSNLVLKPFQSFLL